MDEILRLIKEKLMLMNQLVEAAEAQRSALKENLNGRAVSAATRDVEALLRRVEDAERDTADLLARLSAPSLAEAVNRQPYSPRKVQAWRDLDRLQALIERLRQANAVSRTLLEKDGAYLGFSLNVMTEAQAGPGYDAPEEPARAVQGRKLFDQSV